MQVKSEKPFFGVLKSVDFKSSEATVVLTHEYAVTNKSSDQPVLGTYGATFCLILALYDSENEVAVLAHIDTLTDIDSLSELFNFISINNTVAHLHGGLSQSKTMCHEVVNLLKKNNIKIGYCDMVRGALDQPASLAIDSRTGRIYAPVTPNQLNRTSEVEDRELDHLFKGFELFAARGEVVHNTPLIQHYNGLQTTVSLETLPTFKL